jgi:hypothetical protein
MSADAAALEILTRIELRRQLGAPVRRKARWLVDAVQIAE